MTRLSSFAPPNVSRYNFMGCPLDPFSVEEVINAIALRIKQKKSVSLVHFLNVAKIVRANADLQLRNALWDGDLVLADGQPLIPFGRLLGLHIPERVNGTNLMRDVLTLAAAEGFSVYFLGGQQDVVEKCVRNVIASHPHLRVAGYRNGYFTGEQTSEVVEHINAAAPDVLFVGMGTPQKELFACGNRATLTVPIVQGVGGSFDVVAGVVKRAPEWMQRAGLEWLFRVIQEPKRMLWRYVSTNVRFIALYVVDIAQSRSLHVNARRQ